MAILKPNASRGGEAKGSRDLNFTLSIQALVLDRAEDRATLLATVPAIAAIAGGGGATAFSFRNVETGHGSPFTARRVLGLKLAARNRTPKPRRRKNIAASPARTSSSTLPAEEEATRPEMGPTLSG